MTDKRRTCIRVPFPALLFSRSASYSIFYFPPAGLENVNVLSCQGLVKFCAVRSMNKALAGEYIDIL